MATDVRIKDNHIEEYDENGNCIREYGHSLGNIMQILVSGNKVAAITGNPTQPRIYMHCDGNFVNQVDISIPFSSDVESFQLSGGGNILIVRLVNPLASGQTYEYSTENGAPLRSY
jgi:hypothetical protein